MERYIHLCVKDVEEYTEMISCKTLIHGSPSLRQRFVVKVPGETVCFQLSTNKVMDLQLATKMVTDCGADLIDLNCGCPVKKIRNKGAGVTSRSKLHESSRFN